MCDIMEDDIHVLHHAYDLFPLCLIPFRLISFCQLKFQISRFISNLINNEKHEQQQKLLKQELSSYV